MNEKLSMDNPIMAEMKECLGKAIRAAILKMNEHNVEDSTVDLKISIRMDRSLVMNDKIGRTHGAPEFGYKINISVPLKATLEGSKTQAHAVIEDNEIMLVRDQVSMFDEEGDPYDR